MLILQSPNAGGQPRIELETEGELKLFSYLTPYIEKAGYHWNLNHNDEVRISIYPLETNMVVKRVT